MFVCVCLSPHMWISCLNRRSYSFVKHFETVFGGIIHNFIKKNPVLMLCDLDICFTVFHKSLRFYTDLHKGCRKKHSKNRGIPPARVRLAVSVRYGNNVLVLKHSTNPKFVKIAIFSKFNTSTPLPHFYKIHDTFSAVRQLCLNPDF